MDIQDWFPLGWTGWISGSPRDSQESSAAPQIIITNWPNKAAYQVSGWFSGNQKSRENQLWVGSAYAEWKGEGAR